MVRLSVKKTKKKKKKRVVFTRLRIFLVNFVLVEDDLKTYLPTSFYCLTILLSRIGCYL